jgi:hypothetical protein
MRRAIRIAIVSVAAAVALLFLVPSSADAQVRFEGRFRLPHGDISVGVGDRGYGYYGYPAYPVGSYVPYGYRVIRRPRLGYGFYSPRFACRSHSVYHSHWVPVRSYGRRYIVVERPVERYVDRSYDDRPYRDDRYRDDRYRDDRSYAGDPYYDFNREYWDRSYRNPYSSRHVHTDSCRH